MKFVLQFLTLFLLTILFAEASKAQSVTDLKSGYVSLTIHLSGDHPGDSLFATAFYTSVFNSEIPFRPEIVDDSTRSVVLYSAGPAYCFFRYGGQYKFAVLYPHRPAVLTIHHENAENFTMRYEGPSEDIFNHSDEIEETFRDIFFEGQFYGDEKPQSPEPLRYLDFIEKRLTVASSYIAQKTSSPAIAGLVRSMVFESAKSFFLLERVDRHPDVVQAESPGSSRPERDLSYYRRVVGLGVDDSTDLPIPSYRYLKALLQDTVLALPNVHDVGPGALRQRLEQLFGGVFTHSHTESVFYDLLVAAAIVDQIDQGTRLSPGQRSEILAHFVNPQISDYILRRDDLARLEIKSQVSGRYYLPFERGNTTLPTILERYKGKVVVLDLWATWCGPCIEAFEKIKEVKARYKDQEDVVFVYLTSEHSDRTMWDHFVPLVKGEHYYLYNDQYNSICDQFAITSIPSYVVFDQNQQVIHTHRGGYMGNEKLIEWIEQGRR